jgi:hypothetical protein
MSRHTPSRSVARYTYALCWCAVAASASAATLAAKAREEGCLGRPTIVEGTTLYKCPTQGGMHYFNVQGANGGEAAAAKRSGTMSAPQGFPKVDATTQKSRDAIRRKVLTDELDAEQKLLAEARAAYANGAPAPTKDEQDVPQRYAERVARLRQAVALHEKNIDALKKELATTR